MSEKVRWNTWEVIQAVIDGSDQSITFRTVHDHPVEMDRLVPLINAAYLYENEGPDAFKHIDDLRVDAKRVSEALREGIVLVATDSETGIPLGCVQYKEISSSAASGSTQSTNAYFGMLAVHPNYQGRGVGKKLMGVVEDLGRRRGREVMEIQVVNHSGHLIDLYERMGYQEFDRTGIIPGFGTKPTHFVLMGKALGQQAPSKA